MVSNQREGMRVFTNFLKKHFLFFILIPIVIISQLFLLEPHLGYGLSDLDDGSIYGFKKFANESSNIFSFLIDSYKVLGVYAHQYYYLGILEYFFHDNFVAYHHVTHMFKILATLAAYPFFFVVTGSGVIAFVSVLIFSFSHSFAGSIQLVVTGSDYPAALMLLIFLVIYFYIFKHNIQKPTTLVLALLFFGAALVFSTERVYPIIFLVLIFEVIRFFNSKDQRKAVLKRIAILFSPIFLAIIIKPVFLGLLVPNSSGLMQSLANGRLDHILVPFIAFASTIIPHKFWNLIAVTQTDNFTVFIKSIIGGILPFLLIINTLFGWLLSKKPLRFNLIVIFITIIGIILTYLFALNHSGTSVGPAFLGFYVIGLATAFLYEWLDTKDRYYFGLFFGPFTAFFFIFNMWFATMDRDLVFSGVHRYLTISSIFISLFLGNLIVLIYVKLLKKRIFPLVAVIPSIIITVTLLLFSIIELQDYFKFDLAHGYGNKDKAYMRRQLMPYMANLSSENPRLFYFDIHTDSGNSFYYGNTIISGFDVWTLWLPNVNFKKELVPYFIADFKTLQSSVIEKDGQKLIKYNNTLYKPEHFYAIQFIGRKAIDITEKIKKELII